VSSLRKAEFKRRERERITTEATEDRRGNGELGGEAGVEKEERVDLSQRAQNSEQ
jgi:hypothetical protein